MASIRTDEILMVRRVEVDALSGTEAGATVHHLASA